MNYSVYCHTRVLSQLSVSSTMLGDSQRMLGLLRAAPGVVTSLGENTAECVLRKVLSQVDRCHIDDESPNLSGIGLRWLSCNWPQDNSTIYTIVA